MHIYSIKPMAWCCPSDISVPLLPYDFGTTELATRNKSPQKITNPMHSVQNDHLHSMNWSWMFEQWPCAACHHLPRTHTRTHCYHLFFPPPRQCKDWRTRHVCKPGEVVKPEEGQPSRCCDNERNASVLRMWRYAPSWLVCEMPRRRWCGRDKFIKWPRD